jgi:hypothetical protein
MNAGKTVFAQPDVLYHMGIRGKIAKSTPADARVSGLSHLSGLRLSAQVVHDAVDHEIYTHDENQLNLFM